MMNVLRSIAFGLALLSSVSVSAAEPVAPQPSAERIAAAERLLQVTDYDSLIDRLTESIIADNAKAMPGRLQVMAEAMGRPAPPAELSAKVLEISAAYLRKAFKDGRAELKRGTALIYASRFSEAELDRLIELQNDPLMKKMQAELPGINSEGTALGHALVMRQMAGYIEEVNTAVEDFYRSKS